MRKFLKIWLILFLVNLLARPLLDMAIFSRLDLTDAAFFQILLVPTLQGCLLWWLTGAAGRERSASLLWPELFKSATLRWVCLCDIGMIIAGWAGNDPASSLADAWRIPAIYNGLKALLAGLLILILIARRWRGAPQPVVMAVLAAGMLALGSDHLIQQPTLLLNRLLSALPEFFQGLALYGGFLIAATCLMLKLAEGWRKISSPAAHLLDGSVALLFAYAIVAQLNLFNRAQINQPWLSLIKTLGFLSTSLACLAVWKMFLVSWQPRAEDRSCGGGTAAGLETATMP